MGQALYLNGASGDGYAWGTPSGGQAAWLSGTDTQFTVITRVQMADWTPTSIVYLPSIWEPSPATDQAFEFTVQTDGRLQFRWMESNGSTIQTLQTTSPVPWSATPDQRTTLRAILDTAAGSVEFAYRHLDTDSWTVLASDTAVGASSIQRTTTVPLRVGTDGTGGHGVIDECHYVEFYKTSTLFTNPKFNDPLEWDIGPLPPPQSGRDTLAVDSLSATWQLSDSNTFPPHNSYIAEAADDPGGTTPVNRDAAVNWDVESYTVEYRIDGGTWVGTTYTGPYWEATLDTTTLTNASHTIEARVTRGSDAATGTDTHAFTVDNTATPVNRDAPVNWDVAATVSRDALVEFNVHDAINRDATIRYNVESTSVVGRDLPVEFNIASLVSRDAVIRYDVQVLSTFVVLMFAR